MHPVRNPGQSVVQDQNSEAIHQTNAELHLVQIHIVSISAKWRQAIANKQIGAAIRTQAPLRQRPQKQNNSHRVGGHFGCYNVFINARKGVGWVIQDTRLLLSRPFSHRPIDFRPGAAFSHSPKRVSVCILQVCSTTADDEQGNGEDAAQIVTIPMLACHNIAMRQLSLPAQILKYTF
jgi:hypothetical protein